MTAAMSIQPPNPAPLGRVARKREKVRRELLLAGFRLIGERGLAGVAVADLTEAADCSKGAFYSHFDSRDAFVAELVDQGIDVVGNALDAHGGPLPADEALATALRYALTLAEQQPAWGSFAAAVGRSHGAQSTGFGRRILRDIERGGAEGRFRYADATAAVLVASGVFLSGVIGADAQMLGPETPGEATRHVLLALGVDTDHAADLCRRPLPGLAFDSSVVQPLVTG